MTTGALVEPVSRFVDELTSLLDGLTARSATSYRTLVLEEADALVSAMLAADRRISAAEADAYAEAIGRFTTRRDRPVDAVTARTSDHVLRHRGWERAPSALFTLLLGADRRTDRGLARRYYTLAMDCAHAAVSIDMVPTQEELDAIDRLRDTLLAGMDGAGLARPGEQAPAPAEAGPLAGPVASPDAAVERPLEELLAELDALVGLQSVKAAVRQLASLIQIHQLRAARGLPVLDTSLHLVFTGNPGTGKTTVARLLAQIYRALGVVSQGQLVETDRSLMVAGFVGQTAMKTRAVVESALGGLLLVDEAYALARGGENDFGREAIDTLVKLMEDHRGDLAVVAAGYTEEMATFIATNPGLRSRFTRTIVFPDYTDDELVGIFVRLGETNRYHPTEDSVGRLRGILAATARDKGFGNARFIRNLFEAAVSNQASRLVAVEEPTEEQLTTLIAADLPAA